MLVNTYMIMNIKNMCLPYECPGNYNNNFKACVIECIIFKYFNAKYSKNLYKIQEYIKDNNAKNSYDTETIKKMIYKIYSEGVFCLFKKEKLQTTLLLTIKQIHTLQTYLNKFLSESNDETKSDIDNDE